jgi:hypothetical protein
VRKVEAESMEAAIVGPPAVELSITLKFTTQGGSIWANYELAALRFIIYEQKAQLDSEKRVLERRRAEADASSQRCANLSSHCSSSATHRSRSHLPPGGDGCNLARNLEVEFNEADTLPKTRDTAIMATTAYIAANATNDNEHMRKLHTLALEGI